MEKIKLLGISKNERQSLYTFPKEQKIFEIIRTILTKLGFENEYDDINSFARPADGGGETNWSKEDKITDKRYYETIYTFTNEMYLIQIIFFTKKVVVIFNYKIDKQQKVSKVVNKFILDED